MMFRTNEAAEFLGVRKSTMEAWRCRGGGPPYIKLSKAVRYSQEDLQRFIDDSRRANTSES